jgi:hypothetical protein
MTTKFDNQPDALLADMLGTLDVEAKALAKRMQTIKDELLARGVEKACGDMFTATKSETVRQTMDTEAAKEALGEAWVLKHTKYTPVTSWRVTVRKDALLAA